VAWLGSGVDAGNPQVAAIRTQQRGNCADEGRLARPVRPEQRGDLTGLGDKVQTGEGLDIAETLGEASSLDNRGHHAALSASREAPRNARTNSTHFGLRRGMSLVLLSACHIRRV